MAEGNLENVEFIKIQQINICTYRSPQICIFIIIVLFFI